MKNIKLVIARYEEDINWSNNFLSNRIIYNKGSDNLQCPHLKLKNIGNEGNTYLEHIINNYDNLSDYTIFSQGSLFDNHVNINNVNEYDINYLINSSSILYNCNIKYIGLNSSKRRLQKWNGWNEFDNFEDPCHIYGKKELQKCLKNLYSKYNKNIILDSSNNFKIICNYCGFFLVHKNCILKHNKEFYINLNEDLKKDKLVGYALERLWGSIFCPQISSSLLPTIENFKNKYNIVIRENMTARFYLIHNGDPIRKQFMSEQLSMFGVDPEKVIWIVYPNKNEITDELHNEIANEPNKKTKGQSCVTYKHFLAIQDLFFNDSELGIIMEDNISFNGNIIHAINKYIHAMSYDWNILFDSDILADKYERFNPKPSHSGVILSNTFSPSKGANFVLINQNCYQKLNDNYLPYKMHSDHNYNRVIKEQKLKSYWAVPYNVHYRNLKSSWL